MGKRLEGVGADTAVLAFRLVSSHSGQTLRILFRLRQDDFARDAKSLLLRHELAVHRRIATPPRFDDADWASFAVSFSRRPLNGSARSGAWPPLSTCGGVRG
jgi:hypothetical protein